ncbi:ROK family protein [Frondihabitans sp. PAMC 28766]|uniref:ROK family protein n=1 Tax=Frondihabitans sp. PAMC 28766 TaxID=1795630 RepID=UPI0021016F25|nr:ROK family protein [Frondihabitans sp. PAMC 28766]
MTGLAGPDAVAVRSGPSGLLAGVDIGGTTTQVVLVDRDLTVRARAEAPTPALVSGHAMAATAARLVKELVASHGSGRPLVGVGVGAAGVVDAALGRILVASDSFTGWSGFPSRRFSPRPSTPRRFSTTT